MKRFIFVLAIIIGGVMPKGTEAAEVGVKVIDLENGTKIMVWYPGKSLPGQEEFTHFGRASNLSAYYDARPDLSSGPYPLIIRSHGLGMGALDAVNWSVKVARDGFVVVAFDHSDAMATKLDGTSDLDWEEASQKMVKYHDDFDMAVQTVYEQSLPYLDEPVMRTREISAVLDGILVHPFFQGLIDPDKIGAVGHSYGGATVLALGHQPSIDCTDPASYGPDVCSLDNKGLSEQFLPSQCCRPVYQGKVISFYDPRIKAILAIGPGTFLFWPIYVDKPVMLISGDHFEVNQQNMTKPYEAFPHVYWLVVKNTDHMNWVSWIYNNILGASMFMKGYHVYCVKQAIYRQYSLAFFQEHLNGHTGLMDEIKNRRPCSRINFQYKE